jgi:hypothetical protein
VVWQWHAPELWRRFCIALQRGLAARCGFTVPDFRQRCVIAYSKVVEFQARGVIHVHAPIRLDGAQGPDGPAPDVPLTTRDLEDAIHVTAARVALDSGPLSGGVVYRLRWGAQVDTRTITDTADQQTRNPRVAHPRQVAGYLAKYLTKATEDFGLPQRVHSAAHAATTGASVHAVRLIKAAEYLAEHSGAYARLLAHLASLGYRGHPITKSRGYSVTFGQIRRAKRLHRARPAGLEPDADVRELLDDDDEMPEGFEVISQWHFAGLGYLDLPTAAAAVDSAIRALETLRAARNPNPWLSDERTSHGHRHRSVHHS